MLNYSVAELRAIYNLNGQRVGEGYHGVVVVKGKKYVK